MCRRVPAIAAIAPITAVAVALVALATAPAYAQDVRPPDPQPAQPAKRAKLTKSPKLIQAQAPDYPPAALAAGKEAKVKVRIHIDAAGTVTQVDVVDPVGEGFDEAAVAAAKQYVFEPAEMDGQPAPIVVETAINFVIEHKEETEPPPAAPSAATPGVQPAAPTGPPNHAGPLDQPITLQGTTVERGTRKKLAGIIVSIAELHLDAVSGADGTFVFHGVPPGNYKVLAVDQRYERLEQPITIGKREALEVRLWMRPRDANPYETVVEGEKENLEVTKRTLQRAQLTTVPGTFGDPIRALQTLPGLQRAPFGLGLLLVRGSNPDDTGVYVDGHEVPALFHFLGGPSIFNAEMLDSIDLYPGGFPDRFGRHHGGAVALELRPSKSDDYHGSAKVDFLDSGGTLRGPITDDLSFAVAGRRSYIDLFLGLFVPQPAAGGQRIVTPVYYDYSARLDYNLHENGRLSIFTIGSSDALRVLDKDPNAQLSEDLSSAVKFFRVIGTYERVISGDLKLTISPAWGRDSITATGAEAAASGPFTSLDVVNDTLSYRMRVHGRIDDHFTLDTGLDMLSRVTSYQALVPVEDNLVSARGVSVPPSEVFRGAQVVGLGAYIDLGIDLTSRLKLIPSFRVDGYLLDGRERESVDPRISVRYLLYPTLTLKAYVGHFSQPPQPEGLDSRFGNPNLLIEHAIHTGFGYEWKPDNLWFIESEVYYVHRYDLSVFTSDVVQNPDGTFSNVNFLSEGLAYSEGLEVLIKREISEHAYGWLSYTFSKSRQKNHPDDAYSPTPFDQPHVLNAVASYKPGGGWELGLRYQLSSGRPTTPVIGATYDADTGSYVAIRGPARSARDPLYTELDARVEHDWLFERWTFGVYLDIINVTNRTNVEAIQYDYRFRNSSPVTSFPFLPTLGVKGTW